MLSAPTCVYPFSFRAATMQDIMVLSAVSATSSSTATPSQNFFPLGHISSVKVVFSTMTRTLP